MSDYKFRYFEFKEGETPNFMQGPMVEQLDTEFANLQEAKGKFYTRLVEFVALQKLFNSVLPDEEIAEGRVIKYNTANARIVARFVSGLLEHEYGKNSDDRMDEMMADVDRITEAVFLKAKE